MDYPKYVKIDDRKYKINTNFKVALECNKIATDETIGNYERALAIIYKLYGDEGLDDFDNHNKLLQLGQKYLLCGKEISNKRQEPDMDFEQDYGLIKASFRSDYGINLDNEDIHWWEFNDLLNGLSNSELGNCCILNKVRNIRTYNANEIKDPKERQAIMEAKRDWALKKDKPKLTEAQKESVRNIYKILGGR